MAFLAAVLLVAVAVDELVRRRRRLLAAAAVLPVAVSLAPAPLAAVTPPVPAYFTSSGVQQVPDGSVALVAPYASPYSANAMLWQAASGLRFRMPEGYVLLPTPAGPKLAEYPAPTATSAAMMAVEAGGTVPQDGSQRAAMLADLRRWDVSTVIVGPMTHEDAMVATFAWLLGRPPAQTQGVFVWSGVRA